MPNYNGPKPKAVGTAPSAALPCHSFPTPSQACSQGPLTCSDGRMTAAWALPSSMVSLRSMAD